MFDIIGSLLTGGATGLLGTVISFGAKFFTQKQANAHDLELRKLDIEEMDREAKYAAERHAQVLEGQQVQADMAAFTASINASTSFATKHMKLTPAQQWFIVVVDVVRGLIRPVLTLSLLGCVAWYMFELPEGSDEAAFTMHTICYLAVTATLWWFGSRKVDAAMKGGFNAK